MSWSIGRKQTASIGYRIEADAMILNYRHRLHGGTWEPVEQSISFDRTPCNYGGYRSWFLCPRCWNRVAVLYGAGKYFFCRQCYDLAYSSQHEGTIERQMRKVKKLRQRLGVSGDLLEPIWSKPKNMHLSTFDRLRLEADCASKLLWILMNQRLDAWLERF